MPTYIAEQFSAYYSRRTKEDGRIPFYTTIIAQAVRNGLALLQGEVWWKHCNMIVLGADGNYYDCEGILTQPYGRVSADRAGTSLPSSTNAARKVV